jgi:hypothetical protein
VPLLRVGSEEELSEKRVVKLSERSDCPELEDVRNWEEGRKDDSRIEDKESS